MHILPKGFTKTRRYGGFSGAKCDAYLQRCRQLLHIPGAVLPEDRPECERESTSPTCPRCQCERDLLQFSQRPSWRVVFERLYTAPDTYSPQWHVPHSPASYNSLPPRPWQDRRMSLIAKPTLPQLPTELANQVAQCPILRSNSPRRFTHADTLPAAIPNRTYPTKSTQQFPSSELPQLSPSIQQLALLPAPLVQSAGSR